MTDIDLDHETRTAVEALAWRIRNMDGADPEFVARDFMLRLRSEGWRPTEARPAQPWQVPSGHGSGPTDEWRQARAALENKLHRPAGAA